MSIINILLFFAPRKSMKSGLLFQILYTIHTIQIL